MASCEASIAELCHLLTKRCFANADLVQILVQPNITSPTSPSLPSLLRSSSAAKKPTVVRTYDFIVLDYILRLMAKPAETYTGDSARESVLLWLRSEVEVVQHYIRKESGFTTICAAALGAAFADMAQSLSEGGAFSQREADERIATFFALWDFCQECAVLADKTALQTQLIADIRRAFFSDVLHHVLTSAAQDMMSYYQQTQLNRSTDSLTERSISTSHMIWSIFSVLLKQCYEPHLAQSLIAFTFEARRDGAETLSDVLLTLWQSEVVACVFLANTVLTSALQHHPSFMQPLFPHPPSTTLFDDARRSCEALRTDFGAGALTKNEYEEYIQDALAMTTRLQRLSCHLSPQQAQSSLPLHSILTSQWSAFTTFPLQLQLSISHIIAVMLYYKGLSLFAWLQSKSEGLSVWETMLATFRQVLHDDAQDDFLEEDLATLRDLGRHVGIDSPACKTPKRRPRASEPQLSPTRSPDMRASPARDLTRGMLIDIEDPLVLHSKVAPEDSGQAAPAVSPTRRASSISPRKWLRTRKASETDLTPPPRADEEEDEETRQKKTFLVLNEMRKELIALLQVQMM